MKYLGDDDQAHTEPHDTCRIAYMIHFFLGAGNLLPWNAFITAIDYFGYVYPSYHVEKVFAVAYMGSSLLVLASMMFFGGRLSVRWRLNVGFSMFIFSLLVTVTQLMDWTRQNSRWSGSYKMTVAAISVCGLADGLIGGSLLGSAGKLPKQYMQAVFAGTASSGFFVCIMRIVTKASLPQTPQGLRSSVQLYFFVSSIILLLCIACCNFLHKLPVMEQHQRELHLDHSRSSFWRVAKKIKAPALGVFMIYVVTLSIFPGFLAENLKSKVLQDWYPVLLITAYNASDLLGKCLTAVYIVKSIKKATWCCLARLVMYPLFAACLHGPKWLRAEVPVVVLTFILGLTNGYLTSLIMILTPKTVPNSEAEVAALVMAVSLAVGLLTGSAVGWIWII
ncbi:unnamed protein product [Rhodiola kirilowii]